MFLSVIQASRWVINAILEIVTWLCFTVRQRPVEIWKVDLGYRFGTSTMGRSPFFVLVTVLSLLLNNIVIAHNRVIAYVVIWVEMVPKAQMSEYLVPSCSKFVEILEDMASLKKGGHWSRGNTGFGVLKDSWHSQWPFLPPTRRSRCKLSVVPASTPVLRHPGLYLSATISLKLNSPFIRCLDHSILTQQ